MQHKCNKSKPGSSFCPKFTPVLFSGLLEAPFPRRNPEPALTTTLPLPTTSQSPGSVALFPLPELFPAPAWSQNAGSSPLWPGWPHRLLNGSHDGPVNPPFYSVLSSKCHPLLKTSQWLSVASLPPWTCTLSTRISMICPQAPFQPSFHITL